jgi:hypothetical protein
MRFEFNELSGYEDLVRRRVIRPPKETSEASKGRERQLLRLAHEAFKSHEIMFASPGRWTIAQKYPDGKWKSTYLTEIITCRVGVFVSGDIDSVIFAGGNSGDSDRARLNWVAHSSLNGYLDGKARMGFNSSNRNPAEESDDEIAISEIQERVFDACREICEGVLAEDDWEPDSDEPDPPATFNHETGKIECSDGKHLAELLRRVDADIRESREIRAWVDAIENIGHGTPLELVRNELYDDLVKADVCDAGEMIGDIGIVTASRVYYAHAACKKLAELLDARDQAEASDNFRDHP